MIWFANPLWLWGLLGLTIPIAIHLLSRKEGKTIYIGSLRHLTASDTAQFSSLRLNEILLLLLRLTLIIIFVLILADLQISPRQSENEKWVIVEKGIEKNPEYQKLIDTLTNKHFKPHWLAPGFPDGSDTNLLVKSFSYYKLLYELSNKKLDSAVVLSFNNANKFQGNILPLPSHITWLAVEPDQNENVIDAVTIEGDSILTRTLNSNARLTSLAYSKHKIGDLQKFSKSDTITIREPDTIRIAIFADKEFEYDSKIIQSALLAIDGAVADKIEIAGIKDRRNFPEKLNFLFWLSNSKPLMPAEKTIGILPCENSNLPIVLKTEIFNNYCQPTLPFDWTITSRLNEETALQGRFTLRLSELILKNKEEKLQKTLRLQDQRSYSNATVFAGEKNNSRTGTVDLEKKRASQPMLYILLLLTLLAERIFAFKRNQ
jgi:hypothetical protein